MDREVPATRVAPLGRILVALGMFDSEAMPLIPAEVIDHEARFVAAPPQGATPDYGRYLMSITLCSMCQGRDLRGGAPIEPGAPAGPNIMVYAAPGGWSEAQFISHDVCTGAGVAPVALGPGALLPEPGV